MHGKLKFAAWLAAVYGGVLATAARGRGAARRGNACGCPGSALSIARRQGAHARVHRRGAAGGLRRDRCVAVQTIRDCAARTRRADARGARGQPGPPRRRRGRVRAWHARHGDQSAGSRLPQRAERHAGENRRIGLAARGGAQPAGGGHVGPVARRASVQRGRAHPSLQRTGARAFQFRCRTDRPGTLGVRRARPR